MILGKELISASYQIKYMTPMPFFYNVYEKAIEKNQIYLFSLKQKKMSFQINQTKKKYNQ